MTTPLTINNITDTSIYFYQIQLEGTHRERSHADADLCFHSPQPDTSRSCKSADMGLASVLHGLPV